MHQNQERMPEATPDEPTSEQVMPMVNTCASNEPESHTIARLHARVELVEGTCNMWAILANNRADHIENLNVELHKLTKRVEAADRAIENGREMLRVFPASPDMFIVHLVRRQYTLAEMVNALSGWLEAGPLNMERLREKGGLYPRELTSDQLADRMRIIHLALGAILSIAEGKRTSILTFPAGDATPDAVKQYLVGMLVPEHKGEQKQTLYWCPTCKRHVSPEDLKPALPEYGEGKLVHCSEERGGCGQIVEPRNA